GGDVDELLDPRDGDLVERGDPAGERIDEALHVPVRHDLVHIAVLGAPSGRDVVTAEEDLQGTAAPDEPPEAGHRSAARHGADTDLELAEDRGRSAERRVWK